MNDEASRESATTRRLATIRIAVALIVLVRTTPLFSFFSAAQAEGWWGWPEGGFTTTLGPPLPTSLVAALVVVRTFGAVALLLGVRSRASGFVTSAAAIVVVAQDAFAATHTARLLALAPALVGLDGGCTRALVRDRPLAPAASLALLRAFVASIYLWSAIAKMNVDWWSGRTLQAFRDEGLIAGFGTPALLATGARRSACAIGVFVFELLVGPALLSTRTRRIALAAAIAFHVALQVLVRPDVFGFVMIALLPAFSKEGRGTVLRRDEDRVDVR